MKIQKVALIGLGVLGTLYSDFFASRLPKGDYTVIASRDRIGRYQREGVFINGRPLELHYTTPEEARPADLVIFATKFPGLERAMEDARGFVGERSLIISVLNGISSEELLIEAFGRERVLYCVAYGMSAVKLGGNLECRDMGRLLIGERQGKATPRLNRLAAFFDSIGFPYEISEDMRTQLWSKLMMNVGANQSTAVHQTTYGGLAREGQPRQDMIAAMKEVQALARLEGIPLPDGEIDKWLQVAAALDPDGTTSMRQDILAGRKTEVELFAGTIIRRSKKYGLKTPVNERFYQAIRELEDHGS